MLKRVLGALAIVGLIVGALGFVVGLAPQLGKDIAGRSVSLRLRRICGLWHAVACPLGTWEAGVEVGRGG